jgi:hypothetical protein
MKEPGILLPIHYILGLGQEDSSLDFNDRRDFETDYKKALPAALAVEVFIIFVGTR